MVVKAPDVKFVLVPQGAFRAPKAQASRGYGGMSPQENTQKRRCQCFFRQGWSSLKFPLKSKILNENWTVSKK